MELPLVTIGAINYNNEPYVLETLNSIAAQVYSNIEVIIVDDASTDGSLCKIKEWLAGYQRPCKLVVHSQNAGVHKAYESVIKNASGKYISFIATDDVLDCNKIQQQVSAFGQLDESYGVVYGDVIEIDENSELISRPYFTVHRSRNKNWTLPHGDVFKRVAEEFLIYVQSTLIRTSLVKTFSFQYKALSEDWQLILFLARHSKFFGIDNVMTKYRRHAISLSTQNRRKERYYLWCKSNAMMFYEAYKFPENTKDEKRIVANQIEFHLLDYARQPNSKFIDIIKTWKEAGSGLPASWIGRTFFSILWRRAKLLIKKVFSSITDVSGINKSLTLL
jgi:glycosyltransferase involved in cell wall biosynthesis